MKARGLILLGVSGLLGFVAISIMQKPAAMNANMVRVVVAKTALNFGDHLVPEKLQLVDYPQGSVPAGAFDAIERLSSPTEDRVVIRSIEPNEPVLASKVSGSGGRAILSTVIDPKMRAVTISVNDVKGVAGFIQPGDRVDVFLTRNPVSNTGTPEGLRNDILLQNVKVLGVDQQADDKKDKPTVAQAVTLEVTPQDGQKLTLGGSVGSLSLALRNFSNPDPVTAHTLSISELTSAAVKKAEAPDMPPTPPRPQVEILRGTASTIYDVKSGRAS